MMDSNTGGREHIEILYIQILPEGKIKGNFLEEVTLVLRLERVRLRRRQRVLPTEGPT